MRRKSSFIALAACVGLLAITSLAQADPLPPGGFNSPVSVAPNANIGTVLDSITNQPFTFAVGGNQVQGMYSESVSAGNPNNPLGGLTFTLQFTVNTGPLNGSVQSASMYGVAQNPANPAGFAGFNVNADRFPQPPLTVNPDAVTRTVNGGSVAWSFRDVSGGNQTNLLILNTDAPAFNTDGLVGFSGSGGGVGNLRGFQPVVPEPATLTLALVGLPLAGAFGLRRLRRGKPAVA
jgi:hypothetical protein